MVGKPGLPRPRPARHDDDVGLARLRDLLVGMTVRPWAHRMLPARAPTVSTRKTGLSVHLPSTTSRQEARVSKGPQKSISSTPSYSKMLTVFNREAFLSNGRFGL